MKNGKERFDDCVNYLREIGTNSLAQPIANTILQGGKTHAGVGEELSLGGRPDKKTDPTFDANTQHRRAVRALLLCQRVYFSSLWASFNGNNMDAWPSDTPSWKLTRDASVAYWNNATEADIQDAISAFTITSTLPQSLANAAKDPGEAKMRLPDYKLKRSSDPFPGHATCYSSVMYWLFRSGIASYRWMMANWGTPSPAGLRALFGRGTEIWSAATPFGPHDTLRPIPTGHIVHLFVDTPGEFGGHWLVSNGLGGGYGRNNDQENGRVRREYDLCSLNAQFLAYKEPYEGSARIKQGIAEVIDPLQVPNLI
ncbi:MAG TPA: hypothetical protein VH595_15105 [Verrucomicrobiae bacterium]|jgi:hypothetical protein|nr:hypothetical protein [Verrucomicrobiae bacterium]